MRLACLKQFGSPETCSDPQGRSIPAAAQPLPHKPALLMSAGEEEEGQGPDQLTPTLPGARAPYHRLYPDTKHTGKKLYELCKNTQQLLMMHIANKSETHAPAWLTHGHTGTKEPRRHRAWLPPPAGGQRSSASSPALKGPSRGWQLTARAWPDADGRQHLLVPQHSPAQDGHVSQKSAP